MSAALANVEYVASYPRCCWLLLLLIGQKILPDSAAAKYSFESPDPAAPTSKMAPAVSWRGHAISGSPEKANWRDWKTSAAVHGTVSGTRHKHCGLVLWESKKRYSDDSSSLTRAKLAKQVGGVASADPPQNHKHLAGCASVGKLSFSLHQTN